MSIKTAITLIFVTIYLFCGLGCIPCHDITINNYTGQTISGVFIVPGRYSDGISFSVDPMKPLVIKKVPAPKFIDYKYILVYELNGITQRLEVPYPKMKASNWIVNLNNEQKGKRIK